MVVSEVLIFAFKMQFKNSDTFIQKSKDNLIIYINEYDLKSKYPK